MSSDLTVEGNTVSRPVKLSAVDQNCLLLVSWLCAYGCLAERINCTVCRTFELEMRQSSCVTHKSEVILTKFRQVRQFVSLS